MEIFKYQVPVGHGVTQFNQWFRLVLKDFDTIWSGEVPAFTPILSIKYPSGQSSTAICAHNNRVNPFLGNGGSDETRTRGRRCDRRLNDIR